MADGTILLTCAGKATRHSRYGKSKWALTHPTGNLMGAEAVLSMGSVVRGWDLVVAVNESDAELFGVDTIKLEFERAGLRATIVVVGTPESRGLTVQRAILEAKIDGALCVRDCDNALCFDLRPENAVAVCGLREAGRVDPAARSYVWLDESKRVTFGHEDGPVTDWFCAGAYVFADANDLLAVPLREHLTDTVDAMIEQDHIFYSRRVDHYEDWGTSEDWHRARSSYRTLFVDIDGTLLRSQHRSFNGGWGEGQPVLQRNCAALRELYSLGRVVVVLTTSRPEHWRVATLRQLAAADVPFDKLLMGLPAAGRVLINDTVPERGERTASVIELGRDADGDLGGWLKMVGL